MRIKPTAGPRTLRVLVVDDDNDTADGQAELVKALGYAVRVACSGAGALESARRFHPHVVLLDVGMPEMDGFEVARRIRACSPLPMTIVAVTGWATGEDRARSDAAGIDAHLAKPAEMSVLKDIFEKVESRRPAPTSQLRSSPESRFDRQ